MRHVLALLVLSMLPAATLAAGGINRCLDASGNTVFTDRACSQHGARDMPRGEAGPDAGARAAGAGWSDAHGLISGGLPNPRMGCAPDPGELATQLRIALESRDVNQLSSLYHWPGASSRGADSVLAALSRTAAQGVHAVELESGTAPVNAVQVASTAPITAVSAPVHALRVDHGPAGFEGYPAESTRFAITRHMGCWWIHY